MSASWAGLDPGFAPWAKWLYNCLQFLGCAPKLISGRRTLAEQRKLYEAYIARGRTPPPAAPPTTADMHVRGLAVDIVCRPGSEAAVRYMASLWQHYGGVWGGTFHDPNHWQA